MLFHGKDYENRTRHFSYTGLLLIQASLIPHPKWREAYEIAHRAGMNCPELDDLDYGGIVGVIRVGKMVKEGHSPWFFGPHAWPVEASQVLPFQKYRGHLGLFDFPDGEYLTLLGKILEAGHPNPEGFREYWTAAA